MNLFADLPKNLLDQIKAKKVLKKVKKGSYLYKQDDVPLGIYIVQKGLLGLVHHASTGHELLLRLFKKNQILGHRSFFAAEPYHASGVALQDSEVVFIPKSCILQMIKHDSMVALHFLKVLSVELKMAEYQKVNLNTKEVDQRVIEALLYTKEIDPNYNWTRKEIADFIGSTGPTVTKVLIKLKKQGFLLFKARQIEIVDKANLLKLLNK